MSSRRVGRTVFGTFLVLDMLVAAWVGYAWHFHRNTLVSVKLALFSRFESDRSLFDGPTELAQIDGFQRDPDALVARYRERITRAYGPIAPLPDDLVARAKALALSFSKNGGPGCGAEMPIVDKVGRIADDDGYGCCSDHSEVFLALASIYGIEAREVTHARHATNEIYDPATRHWIYIDPQFAIMARDADGNYLSLLGIRELFDRGEKPVYEFFGNEHHDFFRRAPIEHKFYDTRDDFDLVMVTMGNNVFENDAFHETLGFLPKIALQMIGFTVGPTPGYIVYSDPVIAETYRTLRFRVFAVGMVLAVGTLFHPLQLAFGALRRR